MRDPRERNLPILGEAARAVPDDIDADIVWETASRDALALKSGIEELLLRLEGKT